MQPRLLHLRLPISSARPHPRCRSFSTSRNAIKSTVGAVASSNVASDNFHRDMCHDQEPDMKELGKRAPTPMQPFPQSPKRSVPPHIARPPYAETGFMPLTSLFTPDTVLIHDESSIVKMRNAARLARKILDHACDLAEPGVTTDFIDEKVHDAIIQHNAYPSPLNYAGFPKSVCSSVSSHENILLTVTKLSDSLQSPHI
jgi:hypothetical protein